MTDPRPTFNFHRDFTKQGSGSAFIDPSRPVPVPPEEHQRLIEQAKAEAYERGMADGRQAQADHETLRIANVMDALGARLQLAAIEMRRLEDNARAEALSFAMMFARKIAGKLIESQPVAAIEATARAIFSDLRGTPHVAVRVAPDLVDACKSRIAALMRENGIESKLFVFPDPGIALGDARIEWADGGIVREREKLEMLVDRAASMLFPGKAP